MIQIKWHGEIPPNVNTADLEKIILEDIVINLGDIQHPSKLIFHTIFLGEGPSYTEGPSVLVWGEENDDEYYHCEYNPKTEWVNLDDEEKVDAKKILSYK